MGAHPEFDGRGLRSLVFPAAGGGDVLFSARAAGGSQRILVGDITGHGPAAAACVPPLARIFYEDARAAIPVEESLLRLNGFMHGRLPATLFMAYALVDVSLDRRLIRLWNGGLPGCLRVDRSGQVVAFASLGFPLGVSGAFPVSAECQSLAAEPGDRLFLFTDGLTEAADQEGNPFGADALAGLLAVLPGDGVLDSVLDRLRDHRGVAGFTDDVALVELRL